MSRFATQGCTESNPRDMIGYGQLRRPMYQMASGTLFMLRVIVRVVGPALGICIGAGPQREGIKPWNIACQNPATR